MQIDATLTAVAFSSTEAGIFHWRIDGNIVQADGCVASFFGLDEDELEAGLPIERFLERIHPDDKPDVARAIRAAIVTGESYHETYRIIRPDRTTIKVVAIGRCFRDAAGVPSHYSGVIFDGFPKGRNSREQVLSSYCLAAHETAESIGLPAVSYHLQQALQSLSQPDDARQPLRFKH
jgi:nucleoside-diphosphate-sugar epimerase